MTIGKILAIVGLLGALLYTVLIFDMPYGKAVTDFASCEAAGNPIMESYPRQCRDDEGTLYVEEISGSEESLIRVSAPAEDAMISSPVSVSGEARGQWYFEASFPITVLDANGVQIGQGFATADGEWMTTDFVPFRGTVTFSSPTTDTGTIVFSKDNPSGLPENDASYLVPVRFSRSGAPVSAGCVISGCSAQLCGEEEMASTCEYREEYACFKQARCERQSSGKCGWTLTSAYNQCISNL